jgi:hypothetical protein
MATQLSRRQVLQFGLLGTLLAACTPVAPRGESGAAPAAAAAGVPAAALPASATMSALIENMTGAAQAFLGGLDGAARTQATYAFDDQERFRWHWTTHGRVPRNGLPLTEMAAGQKEAAHALLAASLSAGGYEKAVNIMRLQADLNSDPELYFVTLFGTPGEDNWGWRWEGHHLSHQFTVAGGEVAMTPFFLGAWPTESKGGLRAMAAEEDLALELAASLGPPAIFQEATLRQHVTQNNPRVEPLAPVGVAYRAMTGAQQALVTQLLATYLGSLPDFLAADQAARIAAAGHDDIHFGWAGPLELRQPTYYRLQGPTFLLEHDKSRNGGTHIHSVWRDFAQDFGAHALG